MYRYKNLFFTNVRICFSSLCVGQSKTLKMLLKAQGDINYFPDVLLTTNDLPFHG